jgi:hypothetical protein
MRESGREAESPPNASAASGTPASEDAVGHVYVTSLAGPVCRLAAG